MTSDTRDLSSIPDLTLERYRLGELPADQIAAITARLTHDPILRTRLDALAASDAVIRDQYGISLTRAIAEQLAGPAGRANRAVSSRRNWMRAGSLALASVLLLATMSALWHRARVPGDDRIKGDTASLLVYRKTGETSERMTDGDAARQGDLVRLAYRASAAGFGVIVSIDSRGVVTRHLPVEGTAAVALRVGEPMPLADAYELDDAPRWEQFFLVTSDRAFDVAPVLDAARRASTPSSSAPPATLVLPDGFSQSTFLLRKVS